MQHVLGRGLLCGLLSSVFVCAAAAQQARQQAAPAGDPEGERVIVTGMVPPPDVGDGAPYHSPDDLSAIGQAASRVVSDAITDGRVAGLSDACRDSVPDMMTPIGRDPLARIPRNTPRLQGLYRDKKSQAQKVSQLAVKARDATVKAEDARREAARGANNKSTVEKTELVRQKAVNALEKARFKLMEIQASIADYGDLRLRNSDEPINWADLDMLAVQRRSKGWGLGVPKAPKLDLTVVNTAASERLDERGYFLRLTGVIVNAGEGPAAIPDFVVSILDDNGFALRNEMGSLPTTIRLPPGGGQPFTYDVRPSPRYVGRIVINFASGAEPPPELPVSLVCEASLPGG